MNYNLRKRRINSSKRLPCYLQEHLRKDLEEKMNSYVRLEKLNILENSETDRFYIDEDRITPINYTNQSVHTSQTIIPSTKGNFWKWILKYILVIIFSLICFSIFREADLQNSLMMLKNYSTLMQDFSLNKIELFEKGLKNYFKIEEQKQDLENVQEQLECDAELYYNEVKKLMKDLITEIMNVNKINQEPPINFINQQCQSEHFTTKIYNKKEDSNYSDIHHYFNFTDYALESEGAKVISVFDTEPYGTFILKFWNYDFGGMHDWFKTYLTSKLASSILTPWRKPGDCWAFKGSQGQVQIKLSKKIIIKSITYDHISKDLSFSRNINSAPKEFVISGVEKAENGSEQKIHLVSYEYKLPGPSIQTFLVKPEVNKAFSKIEVKIMSNHGNPDYTCLYKIRVHDYT